MATFDVTLYETQDLANNVGGQALDRAKTYIEGAFSHSEHSVNVVKSSTQPDAPQEIVYDSFSAADPCYPTTSQTYDDLGQWWKEYVQCVLADDTIDCDLLMTNWNGDRGVCHDNRYSVAEGGQYIANLPSSYELYGCDDPYAGMQTALQNLGHALLSGTFDEEDLADTYDHFGTIARTPMEVVGSTNECGTSVDDYTCDEMRFSECTESKMDHTY